MLLLAATADAATRRPSDKPVAVSAATSDAACIECHGEKGFAVPTGETGESRRRQLFVEVEGLRASVHTKEKCVACHADIRQIPHRENTRHAVDCVQCHEKQSPKPKVDEVKAQITITQTMVGLPSAPPPPPVVGKFAAQAGHYLDSIHARASQRDPQRPNASCGDCHGTHEIRPLQGRAAQRFRLKSVETCGGCHEEALKQYNNSVHGAAVKRRGDPDMPVCSDCHSAHRISSVKQDPAKLAITENCGSCHEKELKSYRTTYHGQVTRLGYAHTAKCNDCHTGHQVLPSKDPGATTHTDNRLATCKGCHKQASAGFVSFEPHGNTHDYKRFPAMWIASKFMLALLGAVFLFFWVHSLLWFRRELKEHPGAVLHLAAPRADEPYVQRFSAGVRLAHLLLAFAVMTLALTGTTVLYAESFWAPAVMQLLGGPKAAAIIHRIAAALFATLFFGHLLAIMVRALRHRTPLRRWFGPDSLLPNLQDIRDFAAMLRWFFGKGARPAFDHWTYWEKFDYWAPFWGMFVIGLSGLMLWFPVFFGQFLPGWVFNVATIVHGEEAFLAIVFLFTVHFFNSHFRPEKFPLDIVMFTGSMPLQEFQHERPLEYERLVREGRLDRSLVPPPSARMVRASRMLGFTLIVIGLVELALVLLGFLQNLLS
ncbi:MAG: cytochrome C [Hydrogenophilales bacterium]|nr:cytochrome C [Hydrogenophilales bacterium]